MFYIGIDLGTSAVKLLMMDGEGAIQKMVERETVLLGLPKPIPRMSKSWEGHGRSENHYPTFGSYDQSS